jgi:hypothetical protein
VAQAAEAIVTAALILVGLFDQAAVEQACQQPVQRTNLEANAALGLAIDFFHERIAVAGALGQGHQYVKVSGLERVGHISIVSICNVPVSCQAAAMV